MGGDHLQLNERTFPSSRTARFALCLAGSHPEIPDGALRLDLPSRKAKLLARVQIGDDLDAAVALQHGFSLRSAGRRDERRRSTSPMFTNSASRRVRRCLPSRSSIRRSPRRPVRPRARSSQPGLARIAPSSPPTPRTRGDRRAGADDGLPGLHARDAQHERGRQRLALDRQPHWLRRRLPASVPSRTSAGSGGTPRARSSTTCCRPMSPANPPPATTPTRSASPPGDLPGEHVDGYWSITLYSHPEVRLVPNPIGKYSISSRTTCADPDGGFTIHIAPEQPAGAPQDNWLPNTGPGQAMGLGAAPLPAARRRPGRLVDPSAHDDHRLASPPGPALNAWRARRSVEQPTNTGGGEPRRRQSAGHDDPQHPTPPPATG